MKAARIVLLGIALCTCVAAAAQDFPAKQRVKLIVTFAPGGGADTIAPSTRRSAKSWGKA